jgi:hypothetical protein
LRQLVNFAYYNLSHALDRAQKAELDAALAGPQEREKVIDRQNMEAMRQLGGFGLIAPPPRRPPKPTGQDG